MPISWSACCYNIKTLSISSENFGNSQVAEGSASWKWYSAIPLVFETVIE